MYDKSSAFLVMERPQTCLLQSTLTYWAFNIQ